jgi:hypothetical protein
LSPPCTEPDKEIFVIFNVSLIASTNGFTAVDATPNVRACEKLKNIIVFFM